MNKLRFLTAGESHGKGLTGILEGIPAGLSLSSEDIDRELKRRQAGYGRGGRMKIESDRAEIISGVRWGKTIGSPISLLIENKDWKNWEQGMSSEAEHTGSIDAVTRPRPGHADLSGALKYDHKDIRNILERSSARETAMRVAIGAVAKKFLSEFGIDIGSYVIQIGSVQISNFKSQISNSEEIFQKAETSPVRCPDEEASKKMTGLIDGAVQKGDTLGGIFEVIVTGAPIGLGSHIQWDKRLDGRLAQALMGIQAIKGVEIGAGFETAKKSGSEVMDEIFYEKAKGNRQEAIGFYRETNHAGGIEGGMTNGMPIVIRAAMKPIPTLKKALRSVDIITKEPFEAAYERSDTCAVPAAAVIGEAMTALVISDALIEKFGGDSMEETKRNVAGYLEHLKNF
ncbi:MAG: chorismate synthase [Nitrospirae bacterium GWC2_46_6]|nr:MAG: chorismate synthase [Nitrospirae bacterium GWA2_46_11]OGW23332.1 MAG: chorismate synthase [Nitrospirae bacterium GWC2_46_6]OGW24926.1 MAG: chorismate synthase [Nitrospirae bacterium GWB2_47_37]HAK88254.1 chorismate synthase [Nitrospiraceae bacterium]